MIYIPKNSWLSAEFALNYARELLNRLGVSELPSTGTLINNGHSGFVSAVKKYHGGIGNFRQLLGENAVRTKHGDWKSLEYTLEQAKKIMEAENWNELPGHKVLIENNYSKLSSAIMRHHGGYNNFRKALGEISPRIKMGSWQSLEFTIEQSQEFLREHPEYQTLPGKYILCQLGYSSLSVAICKYHGGFSTFRETLRQHITGKSSKQELEQLLESYVGDD